MVEGGCTKITEGLSPVVGPDDHGLSVEDMSLAVTIERDGANYAETVRRQCRIVDRCMAVLKRASRRRYDGGTGDGADRTACAIFCQKIRACAIAGLYVSSSGHLRDAADIFVRYDRESTGNKCEDTAAVAGIQYRLILWELQ